MHQKNTISDTSCVYESFLSAGLPVSDDMLQGMTVAQVLNKLNRYGYTKIFRHGSVFDGSGDFFVIRDWKDNYHHLEHHESLDTVLDYDADSIGMIVAKP